MTTKSKEEQLADKIKEVEENRQKVIDLIDEAAFSAAEHTIASMKFEGDSNEAIASRKIQDAAAARLLEMGGYNVKRVDFSGVPEFKVTIEDYGANRNQDRAST